MTDSKLSNIWPTAIKAKHLHFQHFELLGKELSSLNTPALFWHCNEQILSYLQVFSFSQPCNWRFRSSGATNAQSLVEWFPTFRDNLMVSSWKVEIFDKNSSRAVQSLRILVLSHNVVSKRLEKTCPVTLLLIPVECKNFRYFFHHSSVALYITCSNPLFHCVSFRLSVFFLSFFLSL